MKKQVCENCIHRKPPEAYMQESWCNNGDSDYYALETLDNDTCPEFKGKHDDSIATAK